MALGKDYAAQRCSIARALELVGERWTLLVVRDAFFGVRRYSDFLTRLGAPRAVLSGRLRALTEAGVLDKVRYQQSPPRDEYVLTEKGLRLWPAVHALSEWGAEFYGADGSAHRREFRHATCGTPLASGSTCPACGGGPVSPAEVRMLPGAGPQAEDPVSRALARPRPLLEPVAPEEDAPPAPSGEAASPA